jgi:hypothetical protein
MNRRAASILLVVIGVIALVALSRVGGGGNSGSGRSAGSAEAYFIGRGDFVKLKWADGTIVCASRDDVDKYMDILHAHDKLALARMESTVCRMATGDSEYQVSEAPFSDNLCIRPTGATNCVWTNRGWLTLARRAAD